MAFCALWKTLLLGVGAYSRITRHFNERPWRKIFTAVPECHPAAQTHAPHPASSLLVGVWLELLGDRKHQLHFRMGINTLDNALISHATLWTVLTTPPPRSFSHTFIYHTFTLHRLKKWSINTLKIAAFLPLLNKKGYFECSAATKAEFKSK